MVRHNHDDCQELRDQHETIKRLRETIAGYETRVAELAKAHSRFKPHGEMKTRARDLIAGPEDGYRLLHGNGGFSSQPSFFCEECHTPWPCSTYLWATGSGPFRLILMPEAPA